jgi:hypothetical protein
MLVYGDHTFSARLQAVRARLAALAQAALADQGNLDLLRTLLIVCGQVEQGAEDAAAQAQPPALAACAIHFRQATAHTADAFYSLAWQQAVRLPPPIEDSGSALHRLLHVLETAADAPDIPLTVKPPEGFGLYALFPEQYLAAAASWLADHAAERARGAVVVGIRSIGTTLAAVVSAALRAAGWQVQTFTVRPTGHPFTRQVELDAMQVPPGAFGLIVDEGPGLSGSSLAATARALVFAGLERRGLAFLPGHAHGPGGAGTDEVQSWWRTTPRYVASVHDLRFAGRPLHEALAAALPEPVTRCEDFSGGLWRRYVYPDAEAWPAVCTGFERIKYRYTLRSGRKIILKFLGLAAGSPALSSTAAAAADLLRARAARGLAAPVLMVAHGFVAVEWVDGAPLPARPCAPATVDAIGCHIARLTGPCMAEEEAHAAQVRLAKMLQVNTCEALGEQAAAVAPRCPPSATALPAYGDGHLHPHEWLRTGAGTLHKVDSAGHDCDHTLVGVQAVAWDVAGAMVEWELDTQQAARLLRAYAAAGGAAIDAAALRFYRAAYLAFRTGQCTLAAQVHESSERTRLERAGTVYRRQLAALLGVAATRAQA